jgi:hypothetical protein
VVVEGAGYVDVVSDEALDQFTADAGAELAIGAAACYVCAAVFGKIGLAWLGFGEDWLVWGL